MQVTQEKRDKISKIRITEAVGSSKTTVQVGPLKYSIPIPWSSIHVVMCQLVTSYTLTLSSVYLL
jgi:hypothetical protein